MNRPDGSTPNTSDPNPANIGDPGNAGNAGNLDESDLEEAKRAAHATEPGMGTEGDSAGDPNTIADDVVDPDRDGEAGYPPSKPVPAEGGGPLP